MHPALLRCCRPCHRPTWKFSLARLQSAVRLSVVIGAVFVLAVAACPAAVRIEAYRGQPLGVGRVTIDLQPGSSSNPWGDDRFTVSDSQGRVLYPAMQNAPARRLLRNFLGIETPWQVTFYFVFRGEEPLRLIVYAPDAAEFTVRPDEDRRAHDELLDEWWDATTDRYQQVFRQAEYPVVVENFLTATWARRLGRDMPEPGLFFLRRSRQGDPWMSRLAANEAYQNNVERDLLLGRFYNDNDEQATIPLSELNDVAAWVPRVEQRQRAPSRTGASPEARPQPPNSEELPTPPDAEIEAIAGHVPHECFYLRFGNFPNYLWFRDFVNHWRGDLANMIVQQAVNHDNGERFRQQIAVGETRLARVMGPRVIRDVAIIGFDPYMRDGAAMGILFHANNSMLLRNNLTEQRQDAMEAHEGAEEQTLRIAGQDVSYIASRDGKLRSYYAVDGDYHLVATSRRLVERFYEAGADTRSLANSAEFREARRATPLARDDTIFLYLSAAFFENLAGPHYRIELDRRLRSIGEMRALRLARLAARAEGVEPTREENLADAGLLPRGFGSRADGSKLLESNGILRDSVRGRRGAMVPIADVPVDRVTPAEAARYEEFARSIDAEVGRFVPIAVAMKRQTSPEKRGWDRITTDVRIAPYSQTRLAPWANMLGPPAPVRVAPIAGDVASAEIVVDALGQPVHLFGGLRDFRTPLIVRQGEVKAGAATAEYIRAYVGGYPRPHLLDRIFGAPTGPFDDRGIARNDRLFDLWLRRADDFFLFSFKRDVLLEVGPQLAMVDAERPAQIRLFVDDVTDNEVATAVSGLGYMRARDTSASAARFMNSLVTQLHVPPEKARETAEDLVDGQFKCPLGGEYELIPLAFGAGQGERLQRAQNGEELPPPVESALGGGHERENARKLWASTAVIPENRFLLTEVPADYEMPLMNWFRGASADVTRGNDALAAHAELDMVHLDIEPEPDESGEGFKLPSLRDLFGGWGRTNDEEVRPAAATEDPFKE